MIEQLIIPILAQVQSGASGPVSNAAATGVADSLFWPWVGYLVLVLIGVIGAGLGSGVEISIYTLSRLRLLVLQSKGDRRAGILRSELEDTQRLITTLLIVQTAFNFLVSYAVTAIFVRLLGVSEWGSIAAQTVILTPLLFVFADTLPKDICRAHADQTAYDNAVILRWLRRLFSVTGVLWFFGLISDLFSWLTGANMTGKALNARARMARLIEEGLGYGTISEQQTDIIDRVLSMRLINVTQEMVPWRQVQSVRESAMQQDVRGKRATISHSFVPVMSDDGAHVAGMVPILQMLTAPIGTKARDLMMAPVFIPPHSDARHAVAILKHYQSHAGIVGVPDRPPLGLVTLKDLVEPLVGDLRIAPI